MRPNTTMGMASRSDHFISASRRATTRINSQPPLATSSTIRMIFMTSPFWPAHWSVRVRIAFWLFSALFVEVECFILSAVFGEVRWRELLDFSNYQSFCRLCWQLQGQPPLRLENLQEVTARPSPRPLLQSS